MTFFLIALLLIILYDLRVSGPGEFNKDYLDKKCTTAVNGIFVILIVFSHYTGYQGFIAEPLDAPYFILKDHLGQMVVVTFLFYSGYGMMEQVRKRGTSYVRGLPKKAGRLLFKFDIAILLFLAITPIIGRSYPLSDILLSFIAWKKVGNSNWYIFDILVLYMIMFAAFIIGDKICITRLRDRLRHKNLPELAILLVLTMAFVYIMMKSDKGTRWYNTVIILPVGCLYSEFREDIERLVMKNDITYCLTLVLAAAVYVFTYTQKGNHGIEGYTLWAVTFIMTVVLITMKVRIYNRVLDWFGKHVFSMYILQRLPMLIIYYSFYMRAHKYIGLVLTFVITMLLSVIFEKATDAMLNIPAKARARRNLQQQ